MSDWGKSRAGIREEKRGEMRPERTAKLEPVRLYELVKRINFILRASEGFLSRERTITYQLIAIKIILATGSKGLT